MVTLDDFLAASKKDAGEMEKARHIYRMTEHAFTKNCRQCPSCIRAEDVGAGILECGSSARRINA